MTRTVAYKCDPWFVTKLKFQCIYEPYHIATELSLCIRANGEVVLKFQAATVLYIIFMQPSGFKFIKINPLALKAARLFFPSFFSLILTSKSKFPGSVSTPLPFIGLISLFHATSISRTSELSLKALQNGYALYLCPEIGCFLFFPFFFLLCTLAAVRLFFFRVFEWSAVLEWARTSKEQYAWQVWTCHKFLSDVSLLLVNKQEYEVAVHYLTSIIFARKSVPASSRCVLFKPTHFSWKYMDLF